MQNTECNSIKSVKKSITFSECYSQHPYKPYNIRNAEKIIIGSIPPYRFAKNKKLLCGDSDWYYGSKDNSFWDILRSCCCNRQTELCTRKKQKDFLKSNKIGIFDMICQCTRKKNCGSSDSDLYNIKLIDACKIIQKNTSQNLQLFFTSQFVADLFYKQTNCQIDLTKRCKQTIKICEKDVAVIILFSPSPSWSRGLSERIRKSKYKNKIRQKLYSQLCK